MRYLRLVLVVFTAICVSVAGLPATLLSTSSVQLLGSAPALAQQSGKKKRRSLLNILFGRKKARKKAVVKKSNRKRRIKKRRNKSKKRRVASKRSGIPAVKKKKVKKLDDAKVILVVGDFLAGGLADGLVRTLSDVASLRVVDKSKGLSGFVRNDIVDWTIQLPLLVEKTKPAYIVAMLGTNDRQQMRVDGKKFNKRTPEWDTAYKKRVAALGSALKASGVAYNWVGLPPVRFKSMNKDFLIFNEFYGKAAASPTGKFVDIWDGFSDAEGNYSRSGPDVNGQIVLLRTKDGINLTRAGRQRLAYYVEGAITKTLGGRNDIASTALAFDVENVTPKTAEYDPARTGKTVVVRLDDPSADGGEFLAGEKIKITARARTSLAVPLARTSAPISVQAGRVDNFTWPPRAGVSVSSAPAVASKN